MFCSVTLKFPFQFSFKGNPTFFNPCFYFVIRNLPVPFQSIYYFRSNVVVVFFSPTTGVLNFYFFNNGFYTCNILNCIFCFRFLGITVDTSCCNCASVFKIVRLLGPLEHVHALRICAPSHTAARMHSMPADAYLTLTKQPTLCPVPLRSTRANVHVLFEIATVRTRQLRLSRHALVIRARTSVWNLEERGDQLDLRTYSFFARIPRRSAPDWRQLDSWISTPYCLAAVRMRSQAASNACMSGSDHVMSLYFQR